MLVFFKSDQCPNYAKANVKRAKQHNSHADHDDDTDSNNNQKHPDENFHLSVVSRGQQNKPTVQS